jgi:uroporphyrinogen III methyltransferase/synthase
MTGLVVRLMDGDPAVFNGLAEEATACVKAGVSFEVVPGVSSVTAVPSYAGVPLTSASSTGVHVLVAGARGVDLTGALDPKVTVVVIGAPTRPPRPSTPSSPPVATGRLPSPSPSAARAPTSAP